MLIWVAVPVAISAAALLRAYGELDEDFLAEWAQAHGIRVTVQNRPMVCWYLRNARVLRTCGALAGYFLPVLATVAMGWGDAGVAAMVTAFVGYLLGALYAEVSLVRPRPDGPRTASLVPRPLAAYLPRRLRLAPRVLGAAIAAASLALALVPFEREWPTQPAPGWILLGVVGGPALALGLERLQGWVVRRPMPFTEPALIAADDAIRAQSAHSLAGSGLAIALVWLSALSWTLAGSDVQLLRWTMWVPAALGMVGAIGVCQYYGHRAWRVHRPLPGTLDRAASA